jgi:hypothetical protein
VAIDRSRLTRELHQFYDFRGKSVLCAGVAGGSVFDAGIGSKRLVAIDPDSAALARTSPAFERVASKLEALQLQGDVVYLEFCLHAMADPDAALKHARSLAPDVVVFDHLASSAWSFFAAEDDAVRRSTEAIERGGFRRRETLHAEQRFGGYEELCLRLAAQGPVSADRVRRFAGVAGAICIPMTYQLVLL